MHHHGVLSTNTHQYINTLSRAHKTFLTMRRNNCFVCIIRPVFLICRLTAFAANCSCLHCRPPSPARFYKSRFLFVCALIASIFLTARVCAAVATLSKIHLNEIWLPLANIAITSTATHMIITSLVNLDLQIKHVHGLLFVISNKRSYAVEEFMGSGFQKTICLMFCEKYAPILVSTFLIIGQQLYQHITLNLVLTLITMLVNISAGLSTFLLFLLVIEIYYWLFGKCHRQIKTVLCERQTHQSLLLEKLKKLQKLQLVVFRNFQMVQDIYNVSLLVYWFCGCSVSVLNFFLLVHAFEEERRPTDEELLLFVECIFACFGACTTIAKIEKLRDMVS